MRIKYDYDTNNNKIYQRHTSCWVPTLFNSGCENHPTEMCSVQRSTQNREQAEEVLGRKFNWKEFIDLHKHAQKMKRISNE